MNAYDANNLTETLPANRLFDLLSGGKPLILLCVYVYRHLTAVHAERVCWIQEINPRHSNA